MERLDSELPKPKLQFVGSCRNKEDLERLQNLKDKSRELGVLEHVEFHKDVMYRSVLNSYLFLNALLEVESSCCFHIIICSFLMIAVKCVLINIM